MSQTQEEADELEEIGSMINGSQVAYQNLAQLLGYNSMEDILNIFAQKIIINLQASAQPNQAEDLKLIDSALDVFTSYLQNSISHRQFVSLPIVK